MKTALIVVFSIIGAVVLLGLVGVAVKSKFKPEDTEMEVRVEIPQRGDLTEYITAPATAEPKRKVEISAKISARVVAIPVEEGQRVFKGNENVDPVVETTLLIKLDASDLDAVLRSTQAHRAAQAARIDVARAEITSRKANIEACKARLEQLDRRLKREKGLLASHDISESVVDETQSLFDEQRAQFVIVTNDLKTTEMNLLVMEYELEAADAEIARAQQNLTYTTIMAPMDGIVTRVNAEEGEMVMTGTMNNPGTVIMEIADLSQMLVIAQVDQTDISKVKVGQKAKVEFQAWPDRMFEGAVEKKALALSAERGGEYFEVEVLLLNTSGQEVLSGLSADVDIETATYHDMFVVPSQAILAREVDELPADIRDDNPLVDVKKTYASVVYRYVEGEAVVTPVKIGQSDTTNTILLEGWTENDKVITGPFKILKTLKHKQKVKDERDKEKESDAKGESETSEASDQPNS